MKTPQGFTLIELIAVILVVSVLAIGISYRFDAGTSARVQTGRDDIIAALFFAQQTAMARSSSTNTVAVAITGSTITVTENGIPLRIHSAAYPLSMPAGVSISAAPTTFSYDKLGKTTQGTIIVSHGGVSTTITVEASGYAHY